MVPGREGQNPSCRHPACCKNALISPDRWQEMKPTGSFEAGPRKSRREFLQAGIFRAVPGACPSRVRHHAQWGIPAGFLVCTGYELRYLRSPARTVQFHSWSAAVMRTCLKNRRHE
jgi:hypothetical protein